MVSLLRGAILAAGRGERLRSAVDGVPKPLVMLGEETLLARQANAMVAMGARAGAWDHQLRNSATDRNAGGRLAEGTRALRP
jgi:choline kinase